ncbi:MAG TPA: heavy metal translocating P-type ATPase [Sulfurospirillum arcachonense]|nr:heavy metal translocating P-type ATPase [Sulfurospirillum arcachonense]
MSKEKINLNISGMTCVNCSNGIERVVNKMEGLDTSKVNFTSNSGEFTIDTEKLNKSKLIAKIKKLGYGVEEDIEALEKAKKESYKKLKALFFVAASFSIYIFIFMFFPMTMVNNNYIIFALASVIQFYPGLRFYSLAYKALSNKNYDMNVLVALGTSAAYFYSAAVVLFPDIFPEHLRFMYFDGAAVIITFILLGRLLEERSKAKATDFLKSLMDLAPQNANLILENGDIKVVLAKDLHVDDIVLIKQGEKVSTDAIIIKGEAEIDTSMITGEPMPVFKTLGDEVIAGTINKTGTLHVKVQKLSSDTTLSKIIALLNEAGSKKLPIARFADKVANIFVPTVIAISILTFLVWYFVVGDSFGAILASISVLIISCPCALGLATPIAIVSSVGKGAQEGILIKNPEILEIIKDIKYAVFDKTGTLTKGEISVKDMLLDEKYLSLIASAELQSEHPISQAIVKYAQEKNIQLDEQIEDLSIQAGLGISATCKGQKILVGNLTLLEYNNINISQQILESFEKILSEGNGAILASIDGECIGVISLEDSLKDGASELIAGLKEKNIVSILLTGDNEVTAKKIASKVGIDLVYAGVMPDEKYKVIKELQEKAKVMFVGDGINDSVSIKQADIGVALNSGSDITKDAGDIILINNQLSSVLKSINLSSKTMTTIKQNLFWAFFYNALGIPLAAGVLYPIIGVMLSPMYAGIAMSFSSVTVVLNSLRLKFAKL